MYMLVLNWHFVIFVGNSLSFFHLSLYPPNTSQYSFFPVCVSSVMALTLSHQGLSVIAGCFPCFSGMGDPSLKECSLYRTCKGLPFIGHNPVFWQTFHCAAEKWRNWKTYMQNLKAVAAFVRWQSWAYFLMINSLGGNIFSTFMLYLWSCGLHLPLCFLEEGLFLIFLCNPLSAFVDISL